MNLIFSRKISLRIFLFCLCFANFSYAGTGDIVKLVFTTPEQNIKINEKSATINVEWQNINSELQTLTESGGKIKLISSSASGLFVNCTNENGIPETLNKGWDHKSFCYKDSTVGVFDIGVTVSTGGRDFSATQKITISSAQNSDPNPSGGNGTTTSTTTPTTTASTTSSTSTDYSSNNLVYSSYVSLSAYDTVALNVEAGRERIAYLHVPIEFKTKGVDKNTGKEIYDTHHRWSFGDGTSGEGNEVSHTYMFPGEYTVVLNSYSQNDDAVDVTKVKVVNADVSVLYHEQYVELINNSTDDVNVGGWKFKGNNKEYTIPRDTIIPGKGSIKIPRVVLGRVGESSLLLFAYPDDSSISEIHLLSDIDVQKQIAEIETKLNSLKDELSIAYQNNNSDPGRNVWVGNGGTRLVSSQDVSSHIDAAKKDVSETVAAPIESSAGKSIVEKVMEFFSSMLK